MSTDPLLEPRMNVARSGAPPLPAPPGRPAVPTCPGRTRAGLTCRATPGSDGWCVNHSPRFSPEERSAWGRLGALSSRVGPTERAIEEATAALPEPLAPSPDAPSFTTAAGVRSYLEKTAAKVAANKLAPSQANAISTLAALAIKLAELELARDTLDAEIESHERGERARMPRISVAP